MKLNNLIFIDRQVQDYQDLANSVKPDTEVIFIDSNQDGIDLITNTLAGRSNLDSVQIVSHGTAGSLQLGANYLNSDTLQDNSAKIQSWGNALTDTGDILFLGCSFAKNQAGIDLVKQISELTGADVAASEDVTGNSDLGGDWELEVFTGTIDQPLGFSPVALDNYNSILGNPGEGLLGAYHRQDDFKGGVVFSKIDSTINFDWGTSKNIHSRDLGNAFSVAWTGALITDGHPTGTYDFRIDSDDGAILFVEGTEVLNHWGDNTTSSGSIYLKENKAYSFLVQYEDEEKEAHINLKWKPPGSYYYEILPGWRLLPDLNEGTGPSDFKYDVPNISIEAVKESISESDKYAEFNLKTDVVNNFSDGSKGVTVYYRVNGQSERTTLTSLSPQRIKVPVDDYVYNNGDRDVTVQLTRGSYFRKENKKSASIEIKDNEPDFNLDTNVINSPRTGSEGDYIPVFGIYNKNSKDESTKTNRDISVYYEINYSQLTADYKDFNKTSGIVTFPTGKNGHNFSIPVKDDLIYEGETPETFKIKLKKNSQYGISENNSQIYYIKEDEPLLSLTKISNTTEGSEDGKFKVSFNRSTPQEFELRLGLNTGVSNAAKPGTFVGPQKGSDYKIYYYFEDQGYQNRKYLLYDLNNNNPDDMKITIDKDKGGTNKDLIIGIEPIDDEIYDPDEKVTLYLKDHANGKNHYYGIDSTKKEATITIKDNEPIVSLGSSVNPQEGFGYGSTLVGLGKSLELETGEYITIKDKPSFNIASTGKFTQEAWIFSDIKNNNKSLVIGGDSVNVPSIWIENKNDILVGFDNKTFKVENVLNNNNWNHLATTFDGTDYQLYVNGLAVYSTKDFQNLSIPNYEALKIGDANNGFIGVIDEVKIWNIARTAREINHGLITPLYGNENGLVGYWNFENNLNDLTANQNHGSATGDIDYLENPATQIGYIEVKLDRKVTAPQGLWIKYNLSGTASDGVDYAGSEVRKVSTDPSSQFNGIIIPEGENNGRIYITAFPDSIEEDDETVTVTLDDYNFDPKTKADSNYGINSSKKSTTLTIKDNQAYQKGIIVLNELDEIVNNNNPLPIKNNSVEFKIKLASQPNGEIRVDIKKDNSSNPGLKDFYFNSNTWNTLQTFTVDNISDGTQLYFEGSSSYDVDLTIPSTTKPSDKVRTDEESYKNAQSIIPEVRIVSGEDIDERNQGYFAVSLNYSAPPKGLTINYSISGSATLNTDYRISDNDHKKITVKAGETEAIIPIEPIIDNMAEGPETIKISLETGTGYTLLSGESNATLNLKDSDLAGLQLSDVQTITDETTKEKKTTFTNHFTPIITEEYILGSPALQLDGTNYVKLDEHSSFDLNNAKKFTLEAWIKPTSNDNEARSVFGNLDDRGKYPALWVVGNSLGYTRGSGYGKIDNVIKQNEWNHIAYTYDARYFVHVYVNGSKVDSPVAWNFLGFKFSPLAIGNSDASSFIGAIDDVRLWNYVRTESQIKNSLNSPVASDEAGLIGNWRFNNNLLDSSTNENNGKEVKTTNPLKYITRPTQPSQEDFAIRLTSKPSDDVTVDFSGVDATEGTLSKSSLTFTTNNWNQYQTVTVTGVADSAVDGDMVYTVKGTTTSNDSKYKNKQVAIEITNIDKDKAIENSEQEVSKIQENENLPKATIKVLHTTLNESDSGNTSNNPQLEINLDKPAGDNGALVMLDFGAGAGNAIYNQDFTLVQPTLVSQTITTKTWVEGYWKFGYWKEETNEVVGVIKPIFISQTKQANPFNSIDVGKSSRPAFVDIDGDGDLDLFVGNANAQIKYYENQGSQLSPIYVEKTGKDNPLNILGIDDNYKGMVTPVFVDFDNDGDLDPLISRYDPNKIMVFRNRGTATNPIFQYLGEHLAYVEPTFGNLNGDGNTLDVIMKDGNRGVQYKHTGSESKIYYNGNTNQTKFDFPQLTFHSYLEPDNENLFNSPNLADIDMDGDLDLVSRDGEGNIVTFFNKGTTTTPDFKKAEDKLNPFNEIKIDKEGSFSLVDLDGDHDLDLIVGNEDGTIKYYEQFQGVKMAPKQTKATVTLRTLPDYIDEDDETIQVTLTPGKQTKDYQINYKDPKANTVELTLKDDTDKAGVTLTKTSGTNTSESNSGDSVTYSVKLNSQPLADVKLTIGTSDSSEGQIKLNNDLVSIIKLQFTPENWNKPQTFVVVGKDDFVDDDDIQYKIVTRVSSQDKHYDDLKDISSESLTNKDDDSFGIKITEPSETKEGKSNIYGVQLSSQPTGEIRVILTPDDEQIKLNQEDIGDPLTLTFNSRNWNEGQMVQVLAVDDDLVEFFHTTNIKVHTESGKVLYGELNDKANENVNDSEDLGELNKTITLKDLAITPGDYDWYKFTLTDTGTSADYAEILFKHDQGDLNMKLYKAPKFEGTEYLKISDSSTDNEKISFEGLAPGNYYLQVFGGTGSSNSIDNNYSLILTNEDSKYNNYTGKTKEVYIQDNDLPTAKIIAGPTASELFGEPSYFTVALSNVAPGKTFGENGLQINYRLVGGTASYGNDYQEIPGYGQTIDLGSETIERNGEPSSNNYTSNTAENLGNIEGKLIWDNLSVSSGNTEDWFKFTLSETASSNGFIQLDFIHANSDLDLKLYQASNLSNSIESSAGTSDQEKINLNGLTAGDYFIKVLNFGKKNTNYKLTIDNSETYQGGVIQIAPGNIQNNLMIVPIDDKLAEGLNIKVLSRTEGNTSENKTEITLKVESILSESVSIKKGTQINFVKGIVGEVVSDTSLTQPSGNNSDNTKYKKYEGNITVKVDSSDKNDIKVDDPAKVGLETVIVKLLPGEDYTIDEDYKQATLGIADDDVPGVRVVEVGTHTVAGENRSAQFEVSLLSEPNKDVKIRLTPGAEVEFVDPVNPTTVEVTKDVYTLDGFDSDIFDVKFDVKLNGLVATNKGDALTVDVALKQQPFEKVTIKLDDGFDSSTNPTDEVNVTFDAENWEQVRQNVVLSYLDKNNVGLGNYQLTAQAKFDPNQVVNIDITDGEADKYTVTDSGIFDIQLNTDVPTPNSSTSFSFRLNAKPLKNITVKLEDGLDNANNTSAKTLTFTPTNWNTYQNVSLSNLDQGVGESYRIKATVTGNITTQPLVNLGITHTQTQVDKKTTELTFKPTEWYKLQTVTVRGSDDNFAEPNLYHISDINYQVSSADIGYNNFFVPEQTIFVVDRILSAKETSSTFKEGLDLLQDGLDNLTVPILGELGGIAPDLIEEFSFELTNKIAQEENLTTLILKGIIDEVLSTLGLNFFETTVDITDEEVTVGMTLNKTYDIFSFGLDGDLGIPALNIGLETEGELESTFDYELSLAFGLHKEMGFFIDTADTGFNASFNVGLSEDFKGQGNLVFLRLDFENDPDNDSKLSFTIEANLKDLDNHAGIRYFDVNGDGQLNFETFSYDLNGDGTIDASEQSIKEPFTAIDVTGKYTELTPTNDKIDANENHKYDEALSKKQEGIYRTTSDGLKFYFDLNRNGKLDVNVAGKLDEPFTTKKSLFNKEFIVKKTQPTTGTGSIPVSYIDYNDNNKLDTGEKINKKWDKNNNSKLDGDINQEGEGTFTNDVGIAFLDKNGNKLPDLGEAYVYSEFYPLTIDSQAVTEKDKNNQDSFVDFDGNGSLDTDDSWDLKVIKVEGQNTEFIDLNRNGKLDSYEPQRTTTLNSLTISDSDETVTVSKNEDGEAEDDGKDAIVTLNILTNGGRRYIDQDGDGTYKESGDTYLDKTVDISEGMIAYTGIESSTTDEDITLENALRINSNDTTITFLDVDGNGKLTIGSAVNPIIFKIEPKVIIKDSVRFVDIDFNDQLTVDDDGNTLESFAEINNTYITDDLKPDTNSAGQSTGQIVKLLNDGDRLTITELKNFYSDNSKTLKEKVQELVEYKFSGNANLGLKTTTSFGGDMDFPSIDIDLGVNLPLFDYGNKESAEETGLTVEFNNITLDFGEFLSSFARPIMEYTDKILDPIKPIVKFLNADTKFLSYINMEDEFNYDGKPGVSVLDIVGTVSKLSNNKHADKIEKAIKFMNSVTEIIEVVEDFNNLPEGDTIELNFGSYSLDDLKGASKEQKDATTAIQVDESTGANSGNNSGNNTTVKANQPTTNPSTQAKNSSKGNFLTKLNNLDGFQIPVLTNPINILRILLGEKDVDLIKYDIPDFEYSIEKDIGPYYPITIAPMFQVDIPVSLGAKTDFSIGYDTHGIESWADTDFEFSEIYKVLDGFYVDDLDEEGNDKPEISLQAGVGVKATLKGVSGYPFPIFAVSGTAGLEGTLNFDLLDDGELAGTSDGKVRGSDILANISNPLNLFQLNGLIETYLKVALEDSILGLTLWEYELARLELLNFNLGGQNSISLFGGAISNSYIAYATVFFDTNGNGELDDGEINTLSDEYGQYTLELTDAQDINKDGVINGLDGQIVAIGGFDTSSGTSAGKFIGTPESTIITPLTSLQVPLIQLDLTADEAETIIKSQLGLDPNFDLESFDSLDAVGQQNELGLEIYLAHIQVQALFNHSEALFDGLQEYNANPENKQLVQTAFAEYLYDRSLNNDVVFDLSNQDQIYSFYDYLITYNNDKYSNSNTEYIVPELWETVYVCDPVLGCTESTISGIKQQEVNLASQFLAQSNQLLDEVAQVGASKSLKEALPALASVKRVVQDEIPDIVEVLMTGYISWDDYFYDPIEKANFNFDEAINQNYTLIGEDLNSFGNRSVKVISNTETIGENSNEVATFTIELSEPAPNQGLTVLYSISGTATFNQDYQIDSETIGQLYIPGDATEGVIELTLINDQIVENLEMVTININAVSEGYLIDPTSSVGLLFISDDEENNPNLNITGEVIKGTFGDDNLQGTENGDLLRALYGDDTVTGGAGNDVIQGAHGNDLIVGGAGSDRLEGNFADDTIQGESGNDYIDGGSGNDRLDGGADNDIILGRTGDDTAMGGSGNDEMEGGKGNDYLDGGADNDWLNGNEGDDILIGNEGDDMISGGDGKDVFFFNSPNEGFDVILDFNPDEGDQIQISRSGFGVDNLDDFRFISGVLDFQGENLALIQNNGQSYSYFNDLTKIITLVDEPTDSTNSVKYPPSWWASSIAPFVSLIEPDDSTILDDIVERGYIKIALDDSSLNDFDLEFVHTLSTALFGSRDKIDIVQSSFTEAIELLANGEVDILPRRVTHTLARDAGLNFDFSPIYFYDYQSIVTPKEHNINNMLELDGLTIGLSENSTSVINLTNKFLSEGIQFTPKLYPNSISIAQAYLDGEVDAFSSDKTLILSSLKQLSTPEEHSFLDVELSKEPISLVLPENDSTWADFVRWVNNIPIRAEELGINSENVNSLYMASIDTNPYNDPSSEITNFLLNNNSDKLRDYNVQDDYVIRVIEENGNYGEIYDRHFPELERNRNELGVNGGLIYSHLFSGTSRDLELIDNDDRNVLDEILNRGKLIVGTDSGNIGFTSTNEDGELVGFDIDFANAIAAALFGNENEIALSGTGSLVEFVEQNNVERFTNVANGIVDITMQATTYNLVRDLEYGVDFSPIYFYAVQGVATRKDSGIFNLASLNGRTVGITANTTARENLNNALEKYNATVIYKEYATGLERNEAYENGEVDAMSTDASLLAPILETYDNSSEHQILNAIVAKEPLAMVVDENQSDWKDVVTWVHYGLLQAEEYGITQGNIDQILADNTDNNPDNDSDISIRIFLGLEGNAGELLGLENDYMVNAIKAVGNYGEIYDRHYDLNVLPRGFNELSTNFGLQIPYPQGISVTKNQVPIISNPIENQWFTNNSEYTYTLNDNLFADDDGDSLTITADNLPLWLSYDAITQTITGTTPNSAGEYMIEISADDGNGGIVTDSFNLFITEPILVEEDTQKIIGNDSNDHIITNNGNNRVNGGDGHDYIQGGEDRDLLFGGDGNDYILGGDGNDVIRGNNGDDFLNGEKGDDSIVAGDGNDTLIGGAGNDNLLGNSGSDIFVLTLDSGEDTIIDFELGIDYLGLGDEISYNELNFGVEGNNTLISSQIVPNLQVTVINQSFLEINDSANFINFK